MVIKLDGKVDEQRMKNAIRLSMDQEPILGCFLKKREIGYVWQRCNSLDSMELLQIKAVDASNTKEEIERFATQTIDVHKDLPVQTALFRGDEDTLCIKCSHVVMDARGLFEYIYLLVDIYNQLKNDPSWYPKINSKGCRSFKQIAATLSFVDKIKCVRRMFRNNRIWKDVDKMVSPLKMEGDHENLGTLSLILDQDLMSNIHEYRKTKGVTIHEFLLGIFTSVWFKLYSPDRTGAVSLLFPVDLRHNLPEKKGGGLCNLFGNVFLNLFSKPDETTEDLILKVSDQIKVLKKDYFALAILPFLKLMSLNSVAKLMEITRKMNESGKISSKENGYNPFPIAFTNFGVLQKEKVFFDDLRVLDVYPIPAVCYNDYLFWAFSFGGETIRVGTGFCETEKNRMETENLFKLIEREIKQTVQHNIG